MKIRKTKIEFLRLTIFSVGLVCGRRVQVAVLTRLIALHAAIQVERNPRVRTHTFGAVRSQGIRSSENGTSETIRGGVFEKF